MKDVYTIFNICLFITFPLQTMCLYTNAYALCEFLCKYSQLVNNTVQLCQCHWSNLKDTTWIMRYQRLLDQNSYQTCVIY